MSESKLENLGLVLMSIPVIDQLKYNIIALNES